MLIVKKERKKVSSSCSTHCITAYSPFVDEKIFIVFKLLPRMGLVWTTQ